MSKIFLKNYWPISPGDTLNETVAYLFCQIRNKIAFNLTNKSKFTLALDLLLPNIKKELFSIIIQEFEELLLDILELDLSIDSIRILKSKILYDLIYKSSHKFLSDKLDIYSDDNMIINEKDLYIRIVLQEDIVILENLIICLLFGSSQLYGNAFNKKTYNIQYLYIEIFLQNLVIRIGDIIVYLIFNTEFTSDKVRLILQQCDIYNKQYLSTRGFEELKNNLLYQNLIYFYIDQPKAIYSNRYRIRIFSPYGIISKTVYMNRTDELKHLSYIQLFTTGLVELQDFLIPKIKYIMFITGKIILYISISFLDNIAQFFFRIIIRSFKKLN